MPSVLRQDFRTTIVKSGSYTRPGAAIIVGALGNAHAHDDNSPRLQDAHGANMVPGLAGGVGFHYRQPVGTKFMVEMAADPISGGKVALFRPRGQGRGQAVYLPYCDNYITSCIVPAAAQGGIDYFFTDNLSGCAVYVDQVNGTNDFILYHANARATQAAQGDLAATTLMDQMHAAARTDYAGWLHAMVTPRASIQKARYFGQAVTHYTQRKTGDGRTNIQLAGEGTNVMGFRHGNSWEFWYQTWALASYDRPDNSWGKLTKGAQQAIAYGQGKILRAERFWP